MLITGKEYRMLAIEQQEMQRSLNYSRSLNNNENSAILLKTMEWNVALAKLKAKDKTFLGDSFVDDRIQNLEPIK
jgi:hypothetical protein